MAQKKRGAGLSPEALALKVLQLDINTLTVDLRYLRTALQQLELKADPDGSLSTDGKFLFYSPRHVLHVYKADPAASVRDYLHTVLHCIFRHMFFVGKRNAVLWDLACDLAVEHIITGLELRSADANRQRAQAVLFDELQLEIGSMTAEKIYAYLEGRKWSKAEIERIRSQVYADDHTIWHLNDETDETDTAQSEDDREKEPSSEDRQSSSEDDFTETMEDTISEQREHREDRVVMETIWADLARQVEVELQTFARERSGRVDALTQNLLAVNREKYDYAGFLKKFAVRSEVLQLNPDEFDYIFYTYGLQLYENIPLIEPLEYKEIRRVRSFVVAIDTSGSTTGALVQRFIQKTYNILQSTESFFSQIELYILQCDDAVREAVRITALDEFEAYLKTMQIRGHGGTDFRPVFAHVDALRRQGELRDLKGLIYFTDGYGTFPAAKPDYETAFVFVDDEYRNPEVPPWAIRLILRPEEI